MNIIAWGVAFAGAALAGLSALADGALFSDAQPRTDDNGRPGIIGGEQSSDRSGQASKVSRATYHSGRNNIERERSHRALAFARVIGQLAAGSGIAFALDLAGEPTGQKLTVAALLGLLTVLLAESVARAIGDGIGEPVTRALAGIVTVIERLLRAAALLGDWLNRLFADMAPEPDDTYERREEAAAQFREVVAAEADVSRDERELLLGIFDFGETTAEEVMVPRVDIMGVERGVPWSEMLDRVRSSQHSRIPVYDESIDEIVGILYVKDLLPSVLADEEPSEGWQSLMRPPVFIPGSKRIADLLREFRQARRHIAIVADEYGGTAGLVTIEDVLEELVGEIRDEYDEEERLVETEDETRYWVSGRLTLDDLSEVLDFDFTREDVSTVGGLILELLGRVPRAGESLNIGPFRVIVERLIRRKIDRVFLERVPDAAGDAAARREGQS